MVENIFTSQTERRTFEVSSFFVIYIYIFFIIPYIIWLLVKPEPIFFQSFTFQIMSVVTVYKLLYHAFGHPLVIFPWFFYCCLFVARFLACGREQTGTKRRGGGVGEWWWTAALVGMGWDGMRGSQCISFSFICLWGPHLVFSAHIRTHTHTHSSDIKLHCWDQSRQPQRPDLNTSWCKFWCRFDTEPKIPFAAKFTLLHFITPYLDLSTSTQGPVDTSDAEYSLSRQPLKAHSHTHNVVS